MSDYEFRYRLNTAPEKRTDGSGQVTHDIEVVFTEQGSGDPYAPVPDHHQTIMVPAADLLVILAMANDAAKVQAYKDLLVANRAGQAEPFDTAWIVAQMEVFMDENDQSALAAIEADAYITMDLGQTYPVTFSL